jgi:hypothetical protein
MKADERANCKSKHVLLLAITGGIATLLVSGCSDFRRAIGMDRSMPDEFAVESRAPLTIPPDYDLRPPQPGAPRPQETPAADKARKVIDNAGPGEPGKQAVPALRAPQGGVGDQGDQNGDQTLSNKLLGYQDTGAGANVEKRETTAIKGVY